ADLRMRGEIMRPDDCAGLRSTNPKRQRGPRSRFGLVCCTLLHGDLVSLALCGLLLAAPAGAQDKTDTKDKIAALLKDLKSSDDTVRYEAITALAEYGPDAGEAVPILVKLLVEPNEELRIAATLTLGKIGKSAVAPVAVLLNNPDVDIRA